jgi:AI-2 transport protein TqsA
MAEQFSAEPDGPGAAPDPRKVVPSGGTDLRVVLLTVVAVVLGGWAVKALGPVLMPLAAAILIALAVMPVRDRVAALVGPRWSWLGVVAAMGTVLLVLALLLGMVALALRQVVAEIPVEPSQVVEIVASAGSGDGEGSAREGAAAGAAGALEAQEGSPEAARAGGEAEARGEHAAPGDLLSGSAGQALRSVGERVLGAAGGAAAGILNSALAVLGGLALILFLTLLILGESGDWRRKVGSALPWPDGWRLRESAEVIAEKMRAYLLIQAGLGLVSAVLYAVWLGVWGIGLLLVWPLLIFVLNFIPTVGSLIGGALPVAYAALTKDVGTAVWVGVGIVAIEMVMGNIVGPRVQGRNVALSPLVVLVALAFWGWAWGIAGALLAVPVTVALVVLGAHVPSLRPWALTLSNRTEWAGLDEATRPG